jgi:excisionase family DNA binding protein
MIMVWPEDWEEDNEDWSDPRVRRIRDVTAHGNIPVDCAYITEIVPGLWQGGCVTGLVLPPDIVHLVSLYPWERYEIRHEMHSETYVRMYDSMSQGMDHVTHLAQWVNECRKDAPVLTHCQAGLNRSSLITATALMLEGMTAGEAIFLIRAKRSSACLCNPAFEEWLRSRPAGGPLLTPYEASRILGVHARTLIRWTEAGRLTSLRTPGGIHRYHESEIRSLLREGM